VTGSQPARGRTDISRRALERVATALAAEALGTGAASIRVRLDDVAGALGLGVAGRIGVAPLGDGGRGGQSVVDRAEAAVDRIRTGMRTVAGREVGRIDVRLTGVDITRKGRVR